MKPSIRQTLSLLKHRKARLFVLLGIILFNIALWFVSAFLAFIIEPNLYENYFDALLKSGITWMIEPGFYNPDAILPIRLIGISTVLIAMVTFSGGIIAYVADALSTFIQKAQTGKGKLHVQDHLVILNWNIKALELIADCAMDDQPQTICFVVLDHRQEVQEAIDQKLYEIPKHLKKQNNSIVVLQGNIFSKQVLDQVGVAKAKTIVLFGDQQDLSKQNTIQDDITVLKTLMLLENICKNPNQTILVDVHSQESKRLIQASFSPSKQATATVIPIVSDEWMGKLIAQTLFFPSLQGVFDELFSSIGVEFYLKKRQPMEEYAQTHHRSLPVFLKDEHLVVTSKNEKDTSLKRMVPISSSPKFHFRQEIVKSHQTIVIIGKNHKLPTILESIQAFEYDGNVQTEVITLDFDELENILPKLQAMPKIDTILILSDESVEVNRFDTDSLIALLHLRTLQQVHHAQIILELLDPRHYDIATSYDIDHTIISNRYISHMIAQIAKQQGLASVYDDILSYDAKDSDHQTKEIYVYQAAQLLQAEFPLVYESVGELVAHFTMASKGQIALLGVVTSKKVWLFGGDLDQQAIQIQADDEFILIEE